MKKLGEIIIHKNLPFRIAVLLLLVIPIVFWQDFSIHIYSHFTGAILPHVITQQWHIVLLNIIMFVTFLIPLSFRRKIKKSLYGSNAGTANVVYDFMFLGVNIAMDLAMLYATILMMIGTAFILVAWVTLYKKIKTEELVTTGIYSYSRHPQYFGFILIILDLFVFKASTIFWFYFDNSWMVYWLAYYFNSNIYSYSSV